MKGVDKEVREANFERVYEILKRLDYDCYMPGQQAIADLNDNYTFFLTDMAIIISWADIIVLVSEDWEESLGCQAEVRTAFAIDLDVYLYTSEGIIKSVVPDTGGTTFTYTTSLVEECNVNNMRGRRP